MGCQLSLQAVRSFAIFWMVKDKQQAKKQDSIRVDVWELFGTARDDLSENGRWSLRSTVDSYDLFVPPDGRASLSWSLIRS